MRGKVQDEFEGDTLFRRDWSEKRHIVRGEGSSLKREEDIRVW